MRAKRATLRLRCCATRAWRLQGEERKVDHRRCEQASRAQAVRCERAADGGGEAALLFTSATLDTPGTRLAPPRAAARLRRSVGWKMSTLDRSPARARGEARRARARRRRASPSAAAGRRDDRSDPRSPPRPEAVRGRFVAVPSRSARRRVAPHGSDVGGARGAARRSAAEHAGFRRRGCASERLRRHRSAAHRRRRSPTRRPEASTRALVEPLRRSPARAHAASDARSLERASRWASRFASSLAAAALASIGHRRARAASAVSGERRSRRQRVRRKARRPTPAADRSVLSHEPRRRARTVIITPARAPRRSRLGGRVHVTAWLLAAAPASAARCGRARADVAAGTAVLAWGSSATLRDVVEAQRRTWQRVAAAVRAARRQSAPTSRTPRARRARDVRRPPSAFARRVAL